MNARATLPPAVVPGGECVFPAEELAARQGRLRELLRAKGIDLLLTSSPENIFWLTGQQTPGYYTFQCLCLPAEGAPFLLLRGLERFNAIVNTRLEDVTGYADDANPADEVAAALKARGWQGKRVAIDQNAWFLTITLYNRLVAGFQPLLDGSGLIEPLRRVKSAIEIGFIEKAGAATDIAMREGLAAIRPGARDNDVVAAIMAATIREGGEYVGMEPLVNSGKRSGIPHATWRRQVLKPGDPMALEFSVAWNRYHASLWRSAWLGTPPDRARRMYDVCLEGLAAGLAALKPGNSCADVHNAVQAVIDRNGFTENYRKRSGYSVGVSFAPDWGEGNIMSLYKGVDLVLQPNMAFHIPIAMRDYGEFTVGVSETAIVTETGCRTLSAIARDLVIVR